MESWRRAGRKKQGHNLGMAPPGKVRAKWPVGRDRAGERKTGSGKGWTVVTELNSRDKWQEDKVSWPHAILTINHRAQ